MSNFADEIFLMTLDRETETASQHCYEAVLYCCSTQYSDIFTMSTHE